MLGTELFVGRRSLRFNALPISIVRIPANTNLIPANNICVHVSLDGISNNAYPSLIHGEAPSPQECTY